MAGSLVAMGDDEQGGNFLRKSDSREISPRHESRKPPVSFLPGALRIRAAGKKRQMRVANVGRRNCAEEERKFDEEGAPGQLVSEKEKETHALFDLEELLSGE
jgi:hypothetical protein